MKKIFCLIFVLAFVLTMPAFASTYYGGFEDRATGIAWGASDYDYNDLVFTLTGSNLVLNTTTGQWFTKPPLNNSGTPFWNNFSQDSPPNTLNVGFCIYGGGSCPAPAPLNPNALYLATSTGASVSDVTFSAPGQVTDSITIMITGDPQDTLGYQDISGNHFFSSPEGTFTFTPIGGSFALIGENGLSQVFSSDAPFVDGIDHFAFFVPEPASLTLLGTGMLGLGVLLRRKLRM